MKKKITAILLALALFSASLIPSAQLYAEEGGNSEAAVENSGVVKDLIEQADGKYKENDKISLILEVNNQTMSQKYNLTAPDISDVRSEDGLEAQLKYAKASQDRLISAIDELDVQYKIVEYYDTILNGIALETSYEAAKKIAALPEVLSVEVNRPIPAPEATSMNLFERKDTSSNEMANVQAAWDRLYSGKKQLIAVIDSGADPEHEIFKKVDEASLRIKNSAEIQQIIKDKEVSDGKYFSAKIPFGFNYADRNSIIKENKKSSHGMHVAGIVAANGEKLKGVAPDAQLAIMRVFGESSFFGGTSPIIYNKAIDDAVKLGVDSINMSLGSTGTTDGRMEATTINALKKAQEAGIVVAIAVGNDGFMGFGALDGPSANNPDFGLTNSPGVADLSLAVASVDNMKIRQKGILLNTEPQKRLLYLAAKDSAMPVGEQHFVHANEGYPEDFNTIDVNGKIALIKRGDKPGQKDDYSFGKKIKNAQDKGAIAVIIYNNIDENTLTSMAWDDSLKITIPACFISKADGELLIKNQNTNITIETEESYIANPNAYRISNFSSWGVSPEGNMKPDISAPGGQIYSSVNNNEYELMSGTSMASPHVAGGIAVVKEYVEKTFPEVQGAEKHQLIKNILMSSASPYLDKKTGAYTSPRAQGAGLLNLKRATQAGVVVLGTNNISSINLRNIQDNVVTVKGQLKNYTKEDKNFKYYAVLNTDTVKNGKIMLQPKLLQTTENDKKSITVTAGSTADFEVSFTLSDEKVKELLSEMPSGFFLEGYVFFEGPTDEQSISVPYVGFKGVWNDLTVLESSIYDLLEAGKKPYYYEKANILPEPYTHLVSRNAGKSVVLGQMDGSTFENPKFDKTKIAFSPNNDGKADYVGFVGTFLRNYKDFELAIYSEEDENTAIYSVAQRDDFGVKNYLTFSAMGVSNFNTSKSHWRWNGRNLSDEVVQDGKYVMVVKVKPDSSDAAVKTQTMKLPIIIDNVYPRIVQSSYNQESGEYKLTKLEENGSGILSRKIIIGEKEYKADDDGVFKLPANTDPKTAVIRVSDNAHNVLELPLDGSIRSGNERTVIVRPIISTGAVPPNKYKWIVLDHKGEKANPYDLAVGNYTLVISNVEEPYELSGDSRISFEIKEGDRDKVIDVPFVYRNKRHVTINVTKPREVSMKVMLVDKNTGIEYVASLRSNTQYEVNVPEGEYKTVIQDLSDEYYAIVSPVDLSVSDKGVVGANPNIQVKKKHMQSVPVKVERGGYQGGLTVLFRGKDIHKTVYQAQIEKGQNEANIELPVNLDFDVYISEVEGYGIEAMAHKVTMPVKPIQIVLKKGLPSVKMPVDKDALLILIKKAKQLIEKDYEHVSWGLFEIALDKADRLYKNSDAKQAEIEEMVVELKAAMDGLVGKKAADKSALKAKIDEAVEIYNNLNEDYEETSKKYLQITIEAARLVYASDDPKLNTEKHITDTINMLEKAIKNLKRLDGKVDRAKLAALIKQADAIIAEENLYKEDGIKNLKEVLKDAKEKFDDTTATQNEIDEMSGNLQHYLGLIESNVNKLALREEIAKAEKLDLREFKLKGKAEFRIALERAKVVAAKKRASQEEVDAAYNELKMRREALVPSSQADNETFLVPFSIKNKENGEASILNQFILKKASVEKIGDKYRYTLAFKEIGFEMNGINFNAELVKLNIITNKGVQAAMRSDIDGGSEYVFDSAEKLGKQEISAVVDVYEELGVEPFKADLVFDWSKAQSN